jgi:hypothetical protein
MRGVCTLLAACLVSGAFAPPMLLAQTPSDTIKLELEKVKTTHPLALFPADGIEDENGATTLRLDNTSRVGVVVLVVGPTTARVELEAERMQTLTVEPGDYEIAVVPSVPRGVIVPSFYGRQTIAPAMHFVHKFVIPGI